MRWRRTSDSASLTLTHCDGCLPPPKPPPVLPPPPLLPVDILVVKEEAECVCGASMEVWLLYGWFCSDSVCLLVVCATNIYIYLSIYSVMVYLFI